jgi:CubicO group peptidase (beta-lactamase class C family)
MTKQKAILQFNIKKQILTILSLICFASSTKAQTLKEWKHIVVPQFDKMSKEHPLVGASLCLIQDGRIKDLHVKGYQDRGQKIKNTKESIVSWGSITKTFTAVAIMQLRDRGKLKLNDPLVKYIPEIRWVRTDSIGINIEEITIRHLLTHTSGLSLDSKKWHYYDDFTDLAHRPIRWKQISAILPYAKVVRKPGVKHVYSNFAFILLGRVVENIEREAYTAYIYKNILMPLRMNSAHFGTSPPHLRHLKSLSYRKNKKDSTYKVFDMDIHNYGIGNSAGGLYASLIDISKYLNFLTGSSNKTVQRIHNKILKPETLDEMLLGQLKIYAAQGYESWIGLGFFFNKYQGRVLNMHSGGQYGFESYIYFNRNKKIATAIIINTRTPSISYKQAIIAKTNVSAQFFLGWSPPTKKKR